MIRLRTFGGLALTTDAPRALTGAATQRRPLALLAVLAAAGDRPVSRERLQALLWPESDEARARRVLAQTIYALRRDLGDAAAVVGTADLRLNPALVAADVAEFERALAAGAYERAAVLYAGPFLDGLHLADAPDFDQWADGERERLARGAHRALERLAQAAAEGGDAEVAAGWWRRLAALDPLNGRVAVGLMEALAAGGDAAGALRHAGVHEALLREEVGAPPDPAVAALAARLRTPTRSTAPVSSTPVLSPATPVAGNPVDQAPEAIPRTPAPTAGPALELTPAPAAPAPANPSSAGGNGTEPAPPIERDPSAAAPDAGAEAEAAPISSEPAGRARRTPAVTRRWLVPLGAAAVGLLAASITSTDRGLSHVAPAPPAAPSLEPALVVVAPFDAVDPALQLWREGMVDVLSRNLDGAGPLRTVSPTVVVRGWAGRADRQTVAGFARGLRAGAAVYGGLVRAGPDSVQATVSVLDTRSGRVTVEVRRREALARMDRLADSLTVAVVHGLAASSALGAGGRASLGAATSVEALRAFLHGEQFYRRAAWDSAVAHYERAAALDPRFTLAHRRLGLVASWRLLQSDSLASAHFLRAGALNRGLGPRDSLLVAADSQSAAANVADTEVGAWPHTRRLFATLGEAARRYPNDPEVWFAVGEARYHAGFGPGVGVSEREALAAFDRAIALDPAFAPAYIHAVELGFNLGGAALGLRYARAYLALDPTEPAHRGVLLLAPLVDPRRATAPETARLLDTARTSALVSARTILRRWPDPAETAVRLSRLLAAGRPSVYPLFADTGFMRRRLAEQLAFRGRLGEAAAVLGDRDVPLRAELALLGALPHEAARATFARWLAADSPLARLALPWWAAARDTQSIRALAGRAAARAARDTAPDARAAAGYDTAAALAHLALARGDTAGALARFAALPDTLCAACYVHRLVRARLLLARGRAGAARRTLEEPLVAFLTPVEVAFAAERARAAAALGDQAAAVADRAFTVAAWRHADPRAGGPFAAGAP